MRKLLIDGVVNLVRYLTCFVCRPADYHGRQISDVDRGCDDDDESYEQGYQQSGERARPASAVVNCRAGRLLLPSLRRLVVAVPGRLL